MGDTARDMTISTSDIKTIVRTIPEFSALKQRLSVESRAVRYGVVRELVEWLPIADMTQAERKERLVEIKAELARREAAAATRSRTKGVTSVVSVDEIVEF